MAESQALFIDPALSSGQFDHENYIDFPDESARGAILSALTKKMKVEAALDIVKIAKSTPGFVLADLEALTGKAVFTAMERVVHRPKPEGLAWKHVVSPEELDELYITMADFEEASKEIKPASIRDGFLRIPNVKFEDVGGLQLLKDLFECHIIRRIKFPEECGVDLETRFLLFGPPGCGKTLIAKAVASEAGASFIHIKGFELLLKYVLQNELAVQKIFSCARACSPCILFFDELEDLTTRCGQEWGGAAEQLLDKLLIELDGADQGKGVYVIGATNCPNVKYLDLLRQRRFGKPLYVPLPSAYERGLILTALGRKWPIDGSVDLMSVGSSSAYENFSGADLSTLMNQAAVEAIEDKLNLRN